MFAFIRTFVFYFLHSFTPLTIHAQSASISVVNPSSDVICPSASKTCDISCSGCSNINIICPYDASNPDACEFCQITCLGNGCKHVVINSTNCGDVKIIAHNTYSLTDQSIIYAPGLFDSSIAYNNNNNNNPNLFQMKNLSFSTHWDEAPWKNVINSTIISSKFVKNYIKFHCYDVDSNYLNWYIYNESILMLFEDFYAFQYYNNISMYDNSQLILIGNGSSDSKSGDFKGCIINLYDNSSALFETNINGDLRESNIILHDAATFKAIVRDEYSKFEKTTIDARLTNSDKAFIDIYMTRRSTFKENVIYCPLTKGAQCNIHYTLNAEADSNKIYTKRGLERVLLLSAVCFAVCVLFFVCLFVCFCFCFLCCHDHCQCDTNWIW